jgi:rubrerythrin
MTLILRWAKGAHAVMSVKGTTTEQNLLKAFAGESQARNRYTYFSDQAKKEGFEQISALFLETADNEKEHARVFFNHLEGGPAELSATYPAGGAGTTVENLLAASEGEYEEWKRLYPEFAVTAEAEGFAAIARSFREIAKVESWHERRYRKILENLETGRIVNRETPVCWKCRNCGYVHEGQSAPVMCPACRHSQLYYELWTEPY